MSAWGASLSASLQGADRVVLLGVGSDLRGDDVAGLMVIQQVVAARGIGGRLVGAIEGHTAPENFTGAIRRLRPSHIVIVDAAMIGNPAGTVAMIDAHDIDGMSAASHALPVSITANFLARELGAEVLFVGIEPAAMELGDPVAPIVEAAVAEVTRVLVEVL